VTEIDMTRLGTGKRKILRRISGLLVEEGI